MTLVGAASLEERPEMLGAYLRAGCAQRFTGCPAAELTDKVIGLEQLWGPAAFDVAMSLNECNNEAARIRYLESALLQRTAKARIPAVVLDIQAIGSLVVERRGRLTIRYLAEKSGVSRQHLTRIFHEHVGITPKLYCRVARFQAGLAFAGIGDRVNWAQAAVDLGYADQSHMIAEFRQFSSLTPEKLARGRWFHPFIERACSNLRDLPAGDRPLLC
jgi:AraC-like DNA-binding protein